MMTRDDLAKEIYDVIYENAPYEIAKAASDSLMKKIDEYVDQRILNMKKIDEYVDQRILNTLSTKLLKLGSM